MIKYIMPPNPNITFQKQDKLHFVLPPKAKLTNWLPIVIKGERRQCGELSFFFCTDKYLLAINKKFLGHNTYTDVITFDYSEGNTLSGEIFISIERVKENAKEYRQSFRRELLRTMVHGTLHLCGYKDKTEAEKGKMREKENLALNLFYS